MSNIRTGSILSRSGVGTRMARTVPLL
jgi:hypothetical protein